MIGNACEHQHVHVQNTYKMAVAHKTLQKLVQTKYIRMQWGDGGAGS